MEDVAARFDDIENFDGAEFPTDTDSGDVHTMKPPVPQSRL